MLDESEIARRLPAWCALSELFVDTEFDATQARSIARELLASGFDVATLDGMLRHDVAPVFVRNAFVGNWTGWKPQDVREMVLAHLHRRERWPARVAAPLLKQFDRMMLSNFEDAWQHVQREMTQQAQARS
ncbi:DUF7079 family protein [Rhizobacter sp. P5_C2]